MGQKHIVGPLVEAVLNGPVGDFCRKTVGRFGAGKPFVGNLTGKNRPNPQFVEEPAVQRVEGVHTECPRDADNIIPALVDRLVLFPHLQRYAVPHSCGGSGILLKKEPLAAVNIVEHLHIFNRLAHIGVLVTASAEHILVAAHL